MDDFITTILIPAAVAGFVELVNRLFVKDWQAAVKIAGAGAIGVILALLTGGLWTLGLVAGLGASGFITVTQKFASKVSQSLE